MAKVSILFNGDVRFTCPGCGDVHSLPTQTDSRPSWKFNGDVDRPTLTPSILARCGHYAGPGPCWCTFEQEEGEKPPFACYVCHAFVTEGRIQFLDDSTHHLRGRTVELPELTNG